MTSLDFASVVKTVGSYWGWYAKHSFDETMQDLIRRKFSDWACDDLLRELVQAKRHDLKSREPPWDTIYASRKRDSRPQRNEFQALLNIARRFNKAHGSDHWSDAETFDHHLAIQAYPILTDTITKGLHPDADGRLARIARNKRASEYICWREYFAEIDEQLPDFLKEPV